MQTHKQTLEEGACVPRALLAVKFEENSCNHQWDIYEHENNLIKITRAQETLEHSFLFADV